MPLVGQFYIASDNITHDFAQNFVGMTAEDIPLATLLDAREALVKDIVVNMPDKHKMLLSGFFARRPDWDLLEIKGASELPAVRWRKKKLDALDKKALDEITRKLESVLANQK